MVDEYEIEVLIDWDERMIYVKTDKGNLYAYEIDSMEGNDFITKIEGSSITVYSQGRP